MNISNILELLPSSLEALNLSSMNLEALDVVAFKKINSLRQLNLNNSNLMELSGDSFAKKYELQTLDICNNNFAEIHFDSMFEDLKDLQVLNIASCQIQVTNDLLQSLTPKLEDVNLYFYFIVLFIFLFSMSFQKFTYTYNKFWIQYFLSIK